MDERQRPAPNAEVTVFGPTGTATITADENGAYHFEGAASGLYAVMAVNDVYAVTASTRIEHKWEGVTSIVTERVTIEGVVVDRETGRPMPEFDCAEVWDTESFRIGFAPANQTSPATHVEDAKGRFTIPIYRPRLPAVVFRAPGYQPYLVRFANDQTGAQIGGVVVPLVPSTVVTGTVVDAKGKPIEGATIALGAMTPVDRDRGAQAMVQSDAKGNFTFEISRDSAQTIVAYHPEYAPSAVTFEPKHADTPNLRIVLTPGGRIVGTVTRDGVPAESVLVLLQCEGFAWRSTRTDTHGHYAFTKVPEGEAEVLVGQLRNAVRLGAGETETVDADVESSS